MKLSEEISLLKDHVGRGDKRISSRDVVQMKRIGIPSVHTVVHKLQETVVCFNTGLRGGGEYIP